MRFDLWIRFHVISWVWAKSGLTDNPRTVPPQTKLNVQNHFVSLSGFVLRNTWLVGSQWRRFTTFLETSLLDECDFHKKCRNRTLLHDARHFWRARCTGWSVIVATLPHEGKPVTASWRCRVTLPSRRYRKAHLLIYQGSQHTTL